MLTSWSKCLVAIAILAVSGCSTYDFHRLFHNNRYDSVPTSINAPLPQRTEYTVPIEQVADEEPRVPAPPRTLNSEEPTEYRAIRLEDAIREGLSNSKVMRDLGGTVLRAPTTARTRFETSLQASDPQFGMEGALSAFDAQFATKAFFEKNDRALNNVFFGGGTRLLRQDLNIYQAELSKQAATGSLFSLRSNTDYDANNAPGNQFPHAWNTNVEAEVRQPLLRGGGTLFNRIAGPNSVPGVYRGVMIAQVDNDIAQEDFDREVQNFVSEIVNAYWELYYAYRDLEGKRNSRDAALATLNKLEATKENDENSAARIEFAREQYFRFQEEVENALAGVPQQITRTSTGSAGGSFRALGGVLAAERRLRYLLGVPVTDERFLRPDADAEPERAEYTYDWAAVAGEALMRRPELRQQRLVVKRREMELTAAQNFLSPQLDAIAMYRFRGFGRNLLDTDGSGVTRFNNAVDDLVSGDFQEWQLGVEFSVPIGFRRAHAAVHHAELLIAKETAVLREQERYILLELSNAVAEVARSYKVSQTTLNRVLASKEAEDLLAERREREQNVSPDQELDAQRRLADAHSRFYRARSEYAVALKNVEYEKGSILDFYDVYLVGKQQPTPKLSPAAVPGSEVPPAPPAAKIDTPAANTEAGISSIESARPNIDLSANIAPTTPAATGTFTLPPDRSIEPAIPTPPAFENLSSTETPLEPSAHNRDRIANERVAVDSQLWSNDAARTTPETDRVVEPPKSGADRLP